MSDDDAPGDAHGDAPGLPHGGGRSAPEPPPPGSLLRPALWFYGGMLGLGWAICWWSGGSPFLHPAAPAGAAIRPLRDAAIGLVAAAVTIGLSEQLTRRTDVGAALADALAALLGRLPVAECVALAVVSSLAEEAFFRGMLQPRIGLVAASAVFGLAHLVPRRDLAPWSAFAAVAGLLFGVLYESTGNLIAPFVAHAVVNGVNLSLLSRRPAARRRR